MNVPSAAAARVAATAVVVDRGLSGLTTIDPE